jgi:hypothetical protein
MGLDKRHFGGGMNSDDEDRLLAPGDYRYALNVRAGSTNGENNGSIETCKGNQLVEVSLPAGVNEVIGVHEDKNTNRVYYFLWNSNGNHAIYTFDIQEKKVYTLASDNENTNKSLNFQRGFLITGIDVIEDGEREFLLWTDNFNSPKKINIKKALSGRSVDGEYGDMGYMHPDYVELIKAAPSFPPTVTYADDADVKSNLLLDKLFQFKYKFVYDDDEHSAYSPISIPPIPNTRGDIYQSKQNRIDITVKKPIDSTGKEIKRLVIAARIGNNSDFFEIHDEDVSFDDVDSILVKFYNDGVYNSIDLADSNKLFDNVPKKAQALTIIEGNRVALGNVVEGFDPVKVEVKDSAKLSNEDNVDIKELDTAGSKKRFSIKGHIKIINPYLASLGLDKQSIMPIWKDAVKDQTVFGGIGHTKDLKVLDSSNEIIVNPNMEKKKQVFSEEKEPGFPVYLAGTRYYDVTNQTNDKGLADVPTFNSTGLKAIKSEGAGKILNATWLQEFEITDIEPGRYILRVGRHDTTNDELQGESLDWQKRSTNVYSITNVNEYDSIKYVRPTEIVFDLQENISGLEIKVMDLSIPRDFIDAINVFKAIPADAATTVVGYLLDTPNGLTNDYDSIDGKVGIHRNIVDFESHNSDEFSDSVYIGQASDWKEGEARTDHNGYFFFTTRREKLRSSETKVKIGTKTLTTSVDVDYRYDNGVFLQNFVEVKQTTNLVYFGAKFAESLRNTITGSIVTNQGQGQEGVCVVADSATPDVSDASGEYELVLYPPTGFDTYHGNVYYSYSDLISVGTLSTDIVENVSYSSVERLLAPVTFNFTDEQSQVKRSFKRGGRYQMGLIYLDRFNRSGTVQTDDNLKLNIPFYYRGKASGYPVINWSIDHDPPSWATHYQWVRTKNLAVSEYIQMIVKDVYYLNNQNEKVNTRAEASFFILDMSSIDDYNKSVGGKLSYTFKEGDRVRFIKNGTGKFYEAPTATEEKLLDLPILSTYTDADGINQALELVIPENRDMPDDIEKGMLVEIYTPSPIVSDSEDLLFYEFGEVYEVIGGKHSSSQGTFEDGDVYYRPRRMPAGGVSYTAFIDDFSFSDTFESRVDNIGRPNKVDRDHKEIRRPSTIYYSEKYIPETNINGLSNFFSLSFETYERKYGRIQKLFAIDNNLDVYQERKVGKVLVDKNVLVGLDGSATVTSGTAVLSQIVYYKGEYGIGDHPESFAEYGGRRYFVDIYRGAVLRLGGDGITPISEYKMDNYFTTRHGLLSKSKYKMNIWGAYNKDFDSYFISYQGINEEAAIEFATRGASQFDSYSSADKSKLFEDVKNGAVGNEVASKVDTKENEDEFGGLLAKDVLKGKFEKDLQSKIESESITSVNTILDREKSEQYSEGSTTKEDPKDQYANILALKNLKSSTLSSIQKTKPDAAKIIQDMIDRAKINNPADDFDSEVIMRDSGSGQYSVDAEPLEKLDGPYISYAVTDETTGQYVVVLADPIDAPIIVEGTTVAFCEATKRWTSFYSWVADGMSSMGMNMCSFKDGKLYIHNRTEKYNNFYGEQSQSELHRVTRSI